MARNYGRTGKERILRGSDATGPEGVSVRVSTVIAALGYALNQGGFYYSVGKPNYSGGFYVTVYDGEDKVKTYFAAHDEPGPIAFELLDVVAGADAIRTFEDKLRQWSPSAALRPSETPNGIATVISTVEQALESTTRSLRTKRP